MRVVARVVIVLLVTGGVAIATSMSTTSRPRPLSAPARRLATQPNSGKHPTSAALVSHFSVLRRGGSAGAPLPPSVLAGLARSVDRRWGLNLAQVRYVAALPSLGVWIVPGRWGACLVWPAHALGGTALYRGRCSAVA